MTTLERRCRLLLLAYPAGYRQDRGEEIIGTLLEATPEGRSWPTARDVRGLIMGGLRARAALNRQQRTAENLRIAVAVGAAAFLALSAVYQAKFAVLTLRLSADDTLSRSADIVRVLHLNAWYQLSAAAMLGLALAVAWVSRWRPVALAALGAAAVAVSLAGWVPRDLGQPVSLLIGQPVSELACLAILALLAGRSERLGHAWLFPVALAAALPLVTDLVPGFWSFPPAMWLIAMGVVSLLWMVIDARPVIATVVLVLAFSLPEAIEGAGPPPSGLVMLILSAVAAVAVWRLRRQSARVPSRRGG